MGMICSRCEKTYERPAVSCQDCGASLVVDLRGQILAGRYRLDSVIGTGSQDSSVWKAGQLTFERPVAVKIMPAVDDLARERFDRGARIASMLAHPHITTVHDYGETDDGQVFLVMEFLEGRVLRAETRSEEPMEIDRVLHIAAQVLRALEEAHSQAVVHRDLKPDNLFLTHRAGDPDFVKVLDFGIARRFTVSDPEDTDQTRTMEQQLTHGWQLCGTPLYMSPEQVGGEALDGRTDLYALGVVMYQLLTGRVPFRAKTQYAVLSQHLQEAPPTFEETRPGHEVPAPLERLVMKALSKKPSDRFATAREMRERLADIQVSMGLAVESTDETRRETVRTHPVVPGTRRDQPAWAFPLFVALAVLFGALVTHLTMESLRPEAPDVSPVQVEAPPAATAAADDEDRPAEVKHEAPSDAAVAEPVEDAGPAEPAAVATPAPAQPKADKPEVRQPKPPKKSTVVSKPKRPVTPRLRTRGTRGKPPKRVIKNPVKAPADTPSKPAPAKTPRKPRIQVLGAE